jgi:hypothetical protein
MFVSSEAFTVSLHVTRMGHGRMRPDVVADNPEQSEDSLTIQQINH